MSTNERELLQEKEEIFMALIADIEGENNQQEEEYKKEENRKGHKNRVNPAEPDSIPKYIDPLPIPPKAKAAGTHLGKTYYEMIMKESVHSFHKCFPLTTLWGYGGIYPGPTIEVMKDESIFVKWINCLPEKHFLPVDRTLHGTTSSAEVRTVVHLHGANVEPDSDGSPDAWFTKNYSLTGSKFTQKIYNYTNNQRGTMLWYHDHSIGTTRLNVYAGLTGMYIIRDFNEERLNLPKGDYEIPLLIQDRSFNEDGSLFYPDAPPFPVSVRPSIVPAFIGNTIAVNGKLWPYLEVEPRKYRFRILNGSNTRGYTLSLSNGDDFIQIGTDGGLIHMPQRINSFEIEPAERMDVVVDFSNYMGKGILLLNADTSPNTGAVMEFRVNKPLKGKDTSEIPMELYPKEHINEEFASNERFLSLSASNDHYGRPMLILDNRMWSDPVTETPVLDSIEIWNIVNVTPFPHPIHVHLVMFKIISRTPFNVDRFNLDGVIEYTGEAEEPHAYERGWKDTFKAEPGMVNKIIMQFKDHIGDYVWHCHILEHEDHDMMRPLRVVDIK